MSEISHYVKSGASLECGDIWFLAGPLERRSAVVVIAIQVHAHIIFLESGSVFLLVVSQQRMEIWKIKIAAGEIFKDVLLDVW